MERQYSNAIFTNFQQELRGNENNDETKFVKLRYVVKAQHVRVRPTSFYKHKCMRIELYGCSANGEWVINFEVIYFSKHKNSSKSNVLANPLEILVSWKADSSFVNLED